jgi:DNA-3-methyladenine glycosylase I
VRAFIKRCTWGSHENMIAYHDKEWGVPVHNDQLLFEFLMLEGAQAGLSWSTILKKRENYRRVFDNFDAAKIAQYDEKKIQELVQNEGIVRNKLKIRAVIFNAQAFLCVVKEFGSFDRYIWQFVQKKTIKNKFSSLKEIPKTTEESDVMSKDLKKRGFKFVGSTICYAFMQAVGMVNDHEVSCFRYNEI